MDPCSLYSGSVKTSRGIQRLARDVIEQSNSLTSAPLKLT